MNRSGLKYLTPDPDRFGNERYYVRKKGRPKIRIKAKYKDAKGNIAPAFMAEYLAALAFLDNPQPPAPVQELKEDTFDWFVNQYFLSPEFARFDPATRKDKRSVLLRFCETAGPLPYKKYRSQDMRASQMKRRDKPGAADKLVKVLRALYNWGMKQTPPLATSNPAVKIERLNAKTDGFKTWTPEEVDAYRAFHKIGTTARLAMEIMMNVGARVSDAAVLGPSHVFKDQNGQPWLKFTAQKGRNRFPTRIEVPMTNELQVALAATPTGKETFLLTSFGKPFVKEGLGNNMRDWSAEAGLEGCSSHGLRKAAAVLMAEAGTSAPELCAVFGWKNLSVAQIYIRQAENRKMARNAFERRNGFKSGESVSLTKPN